GITVPAAEIVAAQERGRIEAVNALLLDKARELLGRREVEYPVDHVMELTMSLIRQNPGYAMQYLIAWANQRLAMGWTPETLRTLPPAQARQALLEASRRFVEEDRLAKAIGEALALRELPELEAHFRERYGAELPPMIRRLRPGPDRDDLVRARVESILRAELIFFERTIMLETMDPLWRNHLYAMDQLRGAIGFRAVSQQDPRIEFKREGSRMFSQVMDSIRDRVTDAIFKVRLSVAPAPGGGAGPGVTPGSLPSAPGATAAVLPAPTIAGPGLMIVGPGLGPVDGAGSAVSSPAPPPGAERPAAAPPAPRAAGPLATPPRSSAVGPAAAPAGTVVKAAKRYGRNDACPQGAGRKYKKCCNRPDGVCTGEGLSRPPAGGDGTGAGEGTGAEADA
ncbi:MAG TPA: hypothetical protein VD963_09065, partial [Phycisphaerales bacterium]|nr:hypothetical protein [Phycisphaerales bacterium]